MDPAGFGGRLCLRDQPQLSTDLQTLPLHFVNFPSSPPLASEESVSKRLQELGVVNNDLRINENKPLTAPSMNQEQKALLDAILKKERVKIIDKSNQTILKFTLEDLFKTVLEKHEQVQIRIYGSTIQYVMNQGKFIDKAFEALEISKNTNELKKPFLKRPGDLDVQFQFTHHPSTEEIWNLQRDVEVYLCNRIMPENPKDRPPFYDDYVTPTYPNNFAILGLSTEEESEDFSRTIDFVFYNKPFAAVAADSINIAISKDPQTRELNYSFVTIGSEGVWQVITDKILRITRIDDKAIFEHSLFMRDFLFSLVKSRIKGFRCIDEKIDGIVLASTLKQDDLLGNLTIKKFTKALTSNPKRGMMLIVQASILLLQHDKTKSVDQLICVLNDSNLIEEKFLEDLKKVLVRQPDLFKDLMDWMKVYALALMNGLEQPRNGFFASWTSHNCVPHIQFQIGEDFLILPVDPNITNTLITRWNTHTDSNQSLIRSILYQLFGQINDKEFPLDINLSNTIESCLHAHLKEFSTAEFERISEKVLHLNHDELLQTIKRSTRYISSEVHHRCISGFEASLEEKQNVPVWLLWTIELGKSSSPTFKKLSYDIWKKRSSTLDEATSSHSIQEYVNALASDRMDLVLQLMEEEGSLQFAERFLPKDLKYLPQILPWITKKFSKPDSLEKGLTYIQSPLFLTLFDHACDDAQLILTDIVSKAVKNEKKLIDFVLTQLESTEEKTQLIAALLLCAYLTKSTDQKSPKIVAHWKKLHALLSAPNHSSKILLLWRWALKNKVNISLLDDKTTEIAIHSFMQVSVSSAKDAKEAHQMFPLLRPHLESSQAPQAAVLSMIAVLKAHKMHKELLEWLQTKQKWINNLKSADVRKDETLKLFDLIKDLIVEVEDKKVVEDCLQIVQSNLLENPEILQSVALIYVEVLKGPNLPVLYKEEKFRSLLNKKNEKLLECLKLELQKDPNSSLEALSTIALDKNGKLSNEVLSIAIPLLPKTNSNILVYWNPLISRILTSSPNQQMKQLIQAASRHVLSLPDSISDELIDGFIKQEIIIPPETSKGVLTQIQAHILSKVQNNSVGQNIELLDQLSKQLYLLNDPEFQSKIFHEILNKACLSESKPKTKNSIPKLNQWLIYFFEGKIIPEGLTSDLKKYMEVWGIEFHADISLLADKLKIDQTVDSVKLKQYQETQLKNQANHEWDKLTANPSHLDLASLKPLLVHIGLEKLNSFVESCAKKPDLAKIITLFSLLESSNKITLKTWVDLYNAASKLVDSHKNECGTLVHIAWKIFWVELRTKYHTESEYPMSEIVSLWGAATKLLINGEINDIVGFLNDSSDFVKLFKNKEISRQFFMTDVPLVIKMSISKIPFESGYDYHSIREMWKELMDQYLETGATYTKTHEEEKKFELNKEVFNLYRNFYDARCGEDEDFLKVERFVEDNINYVCAQIKAEKDLNDLQTKFLDRIIALVRVAKEDRRLTIVKWAVNVYSANLINHPTFAVSVYSKLLNSDLVEIIHQDFLEMLMHLEKNEPASSVVAHFVRNMYFEIIQKLSFIPPDQRTEEQNRLYLVLIDRYINRQAIIYGINNDNKAVYDWTKHKKILQLISSIPDANHRLVFETLYSLKTLQKAFYINIINKGEISINFFEEYLEKAKHLTSILSELTNQDIYILMKGIYYYPIPKEFQSLPVHNFPHELGIQLYNEVLSRGMLNDNGYVSFILAHGLDLPDAIFPSITDEDIRFGTKAMLRQDLFGLVYHARVIEKIHYLLGLSTQPSELWDAHQERQKRVIKANVDEYYSLCGEFIITIVTSSIMYQISEDAYYRPLLEMISLIEDSPERFLIVCEILNQIKNIASSDSISRLMTKLNAVIFQGSGEGEVKRYEEKTIANWLELLNTISSVSDSTDSTQN